MKAKYSPDFHAYRFQEWMESNYPEIVEKYETSNMVEFLNLDEYVKKYYWKILPDWYGFVENLA
jgi:hypothetical protein